MSGGNSQEARVSTLERVQKVLAAVLRVPRESVTPTALLGDIVALDSMTLAEIAAGLDDEFKTRVPSDDLTAVQTVDDLVRLVARAPAR